MAMTTEQALARRNELHEQEAALLARVDEIHVERERIRQAEDPAPDGVRSSQVPLLPAMAASATALARARIDAARGVQGAAAEVDRLAARIEDVEQRLNDGLEHEGVLSDALEAVRKDLDELLRVEFEAFATHAEGFTRDAHAKLDALREPMAQASAAWQEAAAAWQPLVTPNGLRPVQRCPLPPPGAVFGASEPQQPVDGTMLAFEPVDPADEREPMRVAAGSGTHDALRTDPAWQQAGGQGAHGPAPVARPADVEPTLEATAA